MVYIKTIRSEATLLTFLLYRRINGFLLKIKYYFHFVLQTKILMEFPIQQKNILKFNIYNINKNSEFIF